MIDYKYSNLFLSENSVDKQLKIVSSDGIEITNDILHSENFTLEESLCSDSELKIGSCEASSIKFRVSNIVSSLLGKTLTVSTTLEGGEDEPFQIGTYKVYTDKPTADRSYRDITAYDCMYEIINSDVTDWYNGLSFPMTIKALRDSFFSYLGVECVEDTLLNDDVVVQKGLDVTSISGKTVVTAICEINGVFGHINRYGKFEFIKITETVDTLLPANDLYPANDIFPSETNAYNVTGKYISCDYEDFTSQKITGVRIRQSSDETDVGTFIGAEGNIYTIQDNFLVYGLQESDVRNIGANFLEQTKYITYKPFNCSSVGNPCVEVGDNIRINTTREVIKSFVWKRTLTGIQALRDSLSAEGSETYSVDMNSSNTELIQLKGKYAKIEKSVDGLTSTVGDLESQTESRFTQTAEQISAEVTRATGVENSLSASLELKIGKDDNDQIVSMINASSDVINLKSNRLVIDSSNFELDSDGHVSIVESLRCKSSKGSSDYTEIINVNEYGFREINTNVLNADFYVTLPTIYINPEYSSVGALTEISGYDLDVKTDIASFSGNVKFYGNVNFIGTASGSINAKTAENANYATSAGSADSATTATTSTYLDGSAGRVMVGSAGLIPLTGSSLKLGGPSYKWTEVFADTGTINTSDRNEKKNISDIDERYVRMFELLMPQSFMYINGTSGRTHIGFISQDVEEAMNEVGLTSLDFAGFCKDEIENEDGTTSTVYGLRYSEFIALNTLMIQRTRNELSELKQLLIQKGVIDE